MLVELKQRLREISDLNAAGHVLNWDQATYMPKGGAGGRGRQPATLYRLAHERMVAPALGTLIDALAHHGESLPYDSDEASLTASHAANTKRGSGPAGPHRARNRARLRLV